MNKKAEYNKNYNKNHYKNINIRIKPEVNENLEKYCTDFGISKAKFITNAIKYIIDNSIDVSWYINIVIFALNTPFYSNILCIV